MMAQPKAVKFIVFPLLLLTVLQHRMHSAQARIIPEQLNSEPVDSSETTSVAFDYAADVETTDGTAEAAAAADVDNLDWLEQNLLRDVETLRRTVRHIERRALNQQPLQQQQQQKKQGAPKQSKRSAHVVVPSTTSERLNDFWYRNVQLPIMRLLRERAAKRSASSSATSHTGVANPSAGSEKRPQRASEGACKCCMNDEISVHAMSICVNANFLSLLL